MTRNRIGLSLVGALLLILSFGAFTVYSEPGVPEQTPSGQVLPTVVEGPAREDIAFNDSLIGRPSENTPAGPPPSDAPPLRWGFQSAGTNAPLMSDLRWRVSPTTQYPDRVNAKLYLYDRNGVYTAFCSGSFIGPNVVLTAGHCLYDVASFGGWIGNVIVAPAQDGSGYYPYGYQTANWFHVNAEWMNGNTTPDWDWGVLSLPNSNLGNAVGWYTLGSLQTNTLLNPNFGLITEGYPGDKPDSTMWAGSAPSFSYITSTRLEYLIYVYHGQSGSAVRRSFDNMVVTIVSQGVSGVVTAGPRVDPYFVGDIQSFCGRVGCSPK